MVTESAVLWIISGCVLVSIVATLFGCICGCRKTVPKANSVVNTATRSLPDLPVDSERLQMQSSEILWEGLEPNGDTSSELYATVEENKTDAIRGGGGKKNNLSRALTGDSSYGSPSQTDDSLSPYARVKGEHPYDQLKQSEHPYAQVGANGKAGPSHVHDAVLQSTSSRSSVVESGEIDESPVAPPRTRKSISLSQSSLASVSGVSTNENIPAATAIAGGIPANHELPYMTPPLPNNSAPLTQQHFSGDSQDSSKGYTSISVREPLSSIMGQVNRRPDLVDSHYATVSDDSDEMYAAIDEPTQPVYNSGSETYAQIRPPRVPELNVPSASSSTPSDSLHHSNPHSISSVKNAHSRQESSSSAASSVISPNSPKPEKRQANSPLPRPPDPTVDEMYAKVMKKRRSSHSVSSVDPEIPESPPPPLPDSTIPGYERVEGSHNPHCQLSEPNYNPGYETVSSDCLENDLDRLGPGYETVCGEHDSLIPGYERVSGGHDAASDSEPNYEELHPQDGASCVESSYATVNKKRKTENFSNSEPDYASLSRKDPGYERVEGYEPNYETVCRDNCEPNYESVDRNEPPYEKLKSDSSSPDYETVYKQENSLENSSKEDTYSQVQENSLENNSKEDTYSQVNKRSDDR